MTEIPISIELVELVDSEPRDSQLTSSSQMRIPMKMVNKEKKLTNKSF